MRWKRPFQGVFTLPSCRMRLRPVEVNATPSSNQIHSLSFAAGVEDNITRQIVQLWNSLAAKVHFHRWIREPKFLEKKHGCEAYCFVPLERAPLPYLLEEFAGETCGFESRCVGVLVLHTFSFVWCSHMKLNMLNNIAALTAKSLWYDSFHVLLLPSCWWEWTRKWILRVMPWRFQECPANVLQVC